MATHKIKTSWKGNMMFETNFGGHTLLMDTDPEVGGNNNGPKPKMLLLSALAGCTGMDVIPVLKKMKAEPQALEMEVEGDVAENHPKVYSHIRLVYNFTVSDPNLEAIKKAVKLSLEKYCSVTAMLAQSIQLEFVIRVNNEEIPFEYHLPIKQTIL